MRVSLRVAIGCLYALIGAILTRAIHLALRSMFFGPPEWYESQVLPLWTACVVFVAVALWVQFPVLVSAAQGLLITGPPYGWAAWQVTATYLSPAVTVTTSDYIKALASFLCLAVSGAVLNPLISMAVAMVKRRLSRAA